MAGETYTVVVADHAHNGDPDERWTAGTYTSATAAIDRARGIVAESIANLAGSGTRGDALLRLYLSQGDDPFIVGSGPVEWSALSYAKELIDGIDEVFLTRKADD